VTQFNIDWICENKKFCQLESIARFFLATRVSQCRACHELSRCLALLLAFGNSRQFPDCIYYASAWLRTVDASLAYILMSIYRSALRLPNVKEQKTACWSIYLLLNISNHCNNRFIAFLWCSVFCGQFDRGNGWGVYCLAASFWELRRGASQDQNKREHCSDALHFIITAFAYSFFAPDQVVVVVVGSLSKWSMILRNWYCARANGMKLRFCIRLHSWCQKEVYF
jgi:hypothetical protein